MTTGRDPAKLLRWIIKETAVPNYANNPQSESKDNTTNSASNDTMPVTRLADLDDQEREKWKNIILGQTPDVLNNRQSLQSAINKLHQIKHITKPSTQANNDTTQDPNEEIKVCLYIIHNLLDKNEAVLAKLNGIPLLLGLICRSLDVDNEICLDSCTILHDASQNNPMMQNHMYSHNAIQIIVETLQKCSKHNHKIRTKLWALIHVICREHNPNFNIFLTNSGHHEINRVLRIEQNNITDALLKEILRVSRLINYMLTAWSDGNEKVFDRLNLLKSVNWVIYSLHSFVIRLVSNTEVPPQFTDNRMRTAQLILDVLMELVGGIRMFMKRNDKCKKFVIANKNNKDVVKQLERLQSDLGDYCAVHRPKLKLEEKTTHGAPYRFRYYVNNNDCTNEEEMEESKAENEDGDEQIYLAMKDIWNTIHSVLRVQEEYRAQRRKEREEKKRLDESNNKTSNDDNDEEETNQLQMEMNDDNNGKR
eukprot:543166_1